MDGVVLVTYGNEVLQQWAGKIIKEEINHKRTYYLRTGLFVNNTNVCFIDTTGRTFDLKLKFLERDVEQPYPCKHEILRSNPMLNF